MMCVFIFGSLIGDVCVAHVDCCSDLLPALRPASPPASSIEGVQGCPSVAPAAVSLGVLVDP
ncbi:uncharacterized protein METZ01_LOCUS374821, partial [marine metagenome]